ncbi:hypothetical protein V8C86DRAFT_2534794 [Haematococcus lacustris]
MLMYWGYCVGFWGAFNTSHTSSEPTGGPWPVALKSARGWACRYWPTNRELKNRGGSVVWVTPRLGRHVAFRDTVKYRMSL